MDIDRSMAESGAYDFRWNARVPAQMIRFDKARDIQLLKWAADPNKSEQERLACARTVRDEYRRRTSQGEKDSEQFLRTLEIMVPGCMEGEAEPVGRIEVGEEASVRFTKQARDMTTQQLLESVGDPETKEPLADRIEKVVLEARRRISQPDSVSKLADRNLSPSLLAAFEAVIPHLNGDGSHG